AILRFLRSSFSLVSTRISHLSRHEVGQIATTTNFSAYNVAKPLRRQNTPRAWEAIRIPDDGAIQILWGRADAVSDRRDVQASGDNTRLLIELHVIQRSAPHITSWIRRGKVRCNLTTVNVEIIKIAGVLIIRIPHERRAVFEGLQHRKIDVRCAHRLCDE